MSSDKIDLEKIKHQNRIALAEARKSQQVEVLHERQETQWETRDENIMEKLRLALIKEREATRREVLAQETEVSLLPQKLKAEFDDHAKREELRLSAKGHELAIDEPYKFEERMHELTRIREEATKEERVIFAQCLANIYEMLVRHELGVEQLDALDDYVRNAMKTDAAGQ